MLLPSLVGARRTTDAPPMDLVIPHVPVKLANGGRTPQLEAWRDIVRHWMVGEPSLCLTMPLKDWPSHYYNGRNRQKFNALYHQWSVVAKEFLHV